jgi:hypothetical protein
MARNKQRSHLRALNKAAATAANSAYSSVAASASSGGDNSMVSESSESESESESTEVEEVSVGAEFPETIAQTVCIFDTECCATHTI